MANRLILSARATREIGEAYEWYRAQSPRLAEEFLVALDAQFYIIRTTPQVYAEAIPRVRRALLRRFPYAAFYGQRGDVVSVLAVLHTSRAPRRWPRG